MIITNKLGLPRQFMQVAENFYEYKEKQYGATALLTPTRELMLKKKHSHELSLDCSESIWALMGSALHKILENYDTDEHETAEGYLCHEIPNGYKLTGRYDLYNSKEKLITDYKTVSVWSVIFQKDIEKWKKQLLIYAWLLRQNNKPCERGQIICLMRDWQKSKIYEHDYPQQQVAIFTFKFSEEDFEEIENFIFDKFAEIEEAEKLSDYDLPMCTAEERWSDGDKWAVKKEKAARALRVFDNEEAAKEYLYSLNEDYVIEYRKAVNRKCEEYCPVREICKRLQEANQ